MLAQQRREHILAALKTSGAVRAADLTEEFGVSEMTVRRDIADLAARGLLRKVHGGAIPVQTTAHEPTFATKVALAATEKRLIADAASELIEPGSSIALSAGTTAHLLATVIANNPELRPLTIVTNSLPVADTLFNAPGELEVILTGGSRTPSDALVGPVAVGTLGQLHVDKLFLGVHGIDEDAGLTTPNMLEAETNRMLVAAAGHTVVIVDSTKWSTVGLSRIMPLDDVDTLVTDAGLSADAIEAARAVVGRLVLVPNSHSGN